MKLIYTSLLIVLTMSCSQPKYYGTYKFDRDSYVSAIKERLAEGNEFMLLELITDDIDKFIDEILDESLEDLDISITISAKEIQFVFTDGTYRTATYTEKDGILKTTNSMGDILEFTIFPDRLILNVEEGVNPVYLKQ